MRRLSGVEGGIKEVNRLFQCALTLVRNVPVIDFRTTLDKTLERRTPSH